MTGIRARSLPLLLCAVLLPGSLCAQTFKPREPRAVPGELIIKYRTGGFGRVVAENVQKALLARHEVEALSASPAFGIQLVKTPEERIASTIEKLRADSNVAFVSRNYIVYPDQVTPNDPRWKDLWGLQKIGMPAAWQKSQGTEQVIVAVLDTGVDSSHPDLAANLWKTPAGSYGMSFCTDFSGSSPKVLPPQPGAMDISASGHGTHVAGTIAALGNNGTDVAGVAWKVRIMALRFLCATDGSGTTADAIRAMDYAVTNGAHILNNSWGSAPDDIALRTAVEETNARGVLFVASAGNAGQDQGGASANYPAAFRIPNVVAVAASTAQDSLASFSNWSGTLVPIAAPGVGILSTLPGKQVGPMDGTSMAAPHVTGCAALLKAMDMKRQAPELRKLLLDSADAVGSLKGKVEKGRLNCAKALR